jgi:3-hydroxyisobutyrate dehydrogenase and related beta-hydroxyacid dehydrogenases
MKKILIIGYGTMTAGIVKNLHKNKDFEIIVFSRHLENLSGSIILNRMCEVLALSDVSAVISCFKNDEELVAFGKVIVNSQFINHGTIFIDMTTARPSKVLEYKLLIENSKGRFVESPMTGSKIGSYNGGLSLFLHLEDDLRENRLLKDIFKLISEHQYFFEESTEPSKFKLLYNTWGVAMLYSIAVFNPKYYGFTERSEIVANQIISNDGWMAKVCNSKLQQINSKQFDDVSFKLDYSLKDIDYAIEEVFLGKVREVEYLVQQVRKLNQECSEKDFSILGERVDE